MKRNRKTAFSGSKNYICHKRNRDYINYWNYDNQMSANVRKSKIAFIQPLTACIQWTLNSFYHISLGSLFKVNGLFLALVSWLSLNNLPCSFWRGSHFLSLRFVLTANISKGSWFSKSILLSFSFQSFWCLKRMLCIPICGPCGH